MSASTLLATAHVVKKSTLRNAENDKTDGICSALFSGHTIMRFSFRLYHNTQKTCRKSNTCFVFACFYSCFNGGTQKLAETDQTDCI